MNTTTQSEMINVTVQKGHGLDNQQPSLLIGGRFNDHPLGEYAQASGSAESLYGKLRYDLNCIEICSRVANDGIKWYYHADPKQKENAMKITIEVIERFHEKWELSENGCWEWTASLAGKGYGQMKKPGERVQVYAHQLSYMIHFGEIPEGMQVCHSCDNPKCVKPSHLFLGTQGENLQDMKSKDRHLKGSRNKISKLTDDKVRQIHLLSDEGVSQGKIGKIFGISQGTVFKILKGQRWNHIFREINPGRE